MSQGGVASNASGQANTVTGGRRIEERDIVPGRIFYLPPRKELPGRAVRRVTGYGSIDEGTYSHPVVVVSRPADEGHLVHFQLVRISRYRGKAVLTYVRSQRYKDKDWKSFTGSRTSITQLVGHGIYRSHQLQIIRTPRTRKRGKGSQPWC
jgi:hypothetical protein